MSTEGKAGRATPFWLEDDIGIEAGAKGDPAGWFALGVALLKSRSDVGQVDAHGSIRRSLIENE